MKILLCGLSGTGKTTAGNQLAERGWVHFNCEEEFLSNPQWLGDPLEYMPHSLNVVASWGFVPHFMDQVWDIIEDGYLPVWLQGNEEYRLRDLTSRGEAKDFLQDRPRSRQNLGRYAIEPDMVLNVFRSDGSRWDIVSFIHDVYWSV